jgi:hypothetical protein
MGNGMKTGLLQPGGEYVWRIHARDSDGNVLLGLQSWLPQSGDELHGQVNLSDHSDMVVEVLI